MIHTTRVLRGTLMIHGRSAVFVVEQLLDFPVALLSAHTKLKILSGYRIPVLLTVREDMQSYVLENSLTL